MIAATKENRQVFLKQFSIQEVKRLISYLNKLSEVTRSRFGPHPFDTQSVNNFYADENNMAYCAQDLETEDFVGYSIIRQGFLHFEAERLQRCGLNLNAETDCAFAPSVADSWQSTGVGNLLFRFMLNDFKGKSFKRIILWGGVQSSNERAINFYKKNGFYSIGHFDYNGIGNIDMIKEL